VFDDDLVLEPGTGYYLVGKDRTYGSREEIQLSLYENSTARPCDE
jgi:hypothetical protein